ncbi:TetR/AcrR family transcriptional regulator [Nesterenkonia suensis]
MSDQNPVQRSLQLLWDGLPEPTKGPRPTLTLEQIVQAAVELADTDGLEALSMRQLAQRLGVGTMSLYRYVPSKTELLNLMLDAVSGPDEARKAALQSGWRPCLEAAGWGGRRLYLDHPWLLQVNWTRPVLGPNSLADMELLMSGLKDLPVTDQEKMSIVTALGAYTVGTVRQEILWQNAPAETGMTDEEFWSDQIPALERAMASGRYPAMAALAEDTFSGSWEDSFALGLEIFLDGLEQMLRRRPSPQG